MIDYGTFVFVVMVFLAVNELMKGQRETIRTLDWLDISIPSQTSRTICFALDNLIDLIPDRTASRIFRRLDAERKFRRFQRLPGRCRAKRRKVIGKD